MADKTSIEWTRSEDGTPSATWNPITGCTLVSDGCRNCHAAELAATRLKHHPSRKDLAVRNADGVAKFTGKVRWNQQWLDQPLRWRKPRKIFVCAHGDLFHESVPDLWIDKVFAVMTLAPQHIFQVLTKRPARMLQYLANDPRDSINGAADVLMNWRDMPDRYDWPLRNVWFGTSIEDQKTANERIQPLLGTPAAVHWISAEPLLGAINLEMAWNGVDALGYNGLSWVVVGAESGRRARPMDPDWARSLRDQCVENGVAFMFKQWGGETSKAGGRLLDGRLWNEYPERTAA